MSNTDQHPALTVAMSEHHLFHIIKGYLPTARTINRVEGAAMVAQGEVESDFGAALLVAPEPLITKIGGVALMAHGVDTLTAGWHALRNGEAPRTLTERAARAAAMQVHASPVMADVVGMGADMAVPGGIVHLARHALERGVVRATAVGANQLRLDPSDIDSDHFPGHAANDPRSAIPDHPAALPGSVGFSHPGMSQPGAARMPFQGGRPNVSSSVHRPVPSIRRPGPVSGSEEWFEAQRQAREEWRPVNQDHFYAHYLDRYDTLPWEGPETNHKIGSHVLRKHVYPMQKSPSEFDAFVENRFRRGRSVVSFFRSKDEAERVILEALKANARNIEAWMEKAPEGTEKDFDHLFTYDFGVVIQRKDRISRSGQKVSVRIVKKVYKGAAYYVKTVRIF